MKSQHRHELQTNDLSRLVEQLKEWYDVHGTKATAVILVVLVMSAIATYWVRHSHATRAQGWSAFAACRTAADFANVADDFDGTEVAAWAQLNAAERQLDQGVQLMFTDRSAAISELKSAADRLNTVLNLKSAPKPVRERGLMALARLRETVCDGDAQSAVQLYQQLLDEFPESVFRNTAQQRIDALQTGNAQEFYAWFHGQNPRPADMEKPRDLLETGQAAGSDLPSGIEQLPATSGPATSEVTGPALTFPEAPADTSKSTDSDSKGEETPATLQESSAEAQPSAEAPETPSNQQPAEPAAKDAAGADKKK